MGNEINEVINNICDRLGILATELIPEMANMHIAEDIIAIVITLVALVAVIILTVLYSRKNKVNDELEIAICAGWMLVVIGLALCAFLFVPDLAKWIVSPKACAVDYIMRML